MFKYESEIEFHHDKCDITYKKEGNNVFLQVNDLVVFDNVSVLDSDIFERRDLESGLEKAYDILVRSPQLITSRDYPLLFGDRNIANAKLPTFELLRSLGIKKINNPTGIDFTKDAKHNGRELIVKTRQYASYDDVKWFDYEILYLIEHRNDGYIVRGILKSELG